MPVDHRSVHPAIAGVPWWAAVLIAVGLTLLGFTVDAVSGGKQLTGIFAALYILGCVTAVLAVRRSGLFTAMIQPPLILFCSVPSGYFLLHGTGYTGLRDLLINCGYPLIERFPLMLFTSALVLLIGLARLFFALTARDTPADAPTGSPAGGSARVRTAAVATAGLGLVGAISGKLASIWGGGSAGDDESQPRRHTISRSARTDRRAAPERRTRRPQPAAADRSDRPRRPRPPRDLGPEAPPRRRQRPTRDFDPDFDPAQPPPRRRPRPTGGYAPADEPADARPRRPRRPDTADRAERPRRPRPTRDFDPAFDPAQAPPRRRPRPAREQAREPDRRGGYDPGGPREPRERREPREPRPYRDDPYEPMDRGARPRVPTGPDRVDPSHHPVSRVRYRGAPTDGEADAWKYDI